MDVSKSENQSGIGLFASVVEETGLPLELASQELSEILGQSGMTADHLTLDQLRAAMLAYLEAFAPEEIENPSEAILPEASGVATPKPA